jgi:hypothetical protein
MAGPPRVPPYNTSQVLQLVYQCTTVHTMQINKYFSLPLSITETLSTQQLAVALVLSLFIHKTQT